MAGGEAPVLDTGVLDALAASVGDDRGFVRELIETYLADGEAQVQAIHAALRTDDSAGLVRPAHTLKSSSATLGAMRIAATARDLEMDGRSGRPTGNATPEDLAAGLLDDWHQAAAALREWATSGDPR